jgi:transketolase
MAVQVADSLQAQGRSVSLVSVHTLKPLDLAGLADVLASHRETIVIEEMSPQGSLGIKVKALAYERGAGCRIHCFSLRDEFVHVYGSHQDVLAAHGLTVDDVVAGVVGA